MDKRDKLQQMMAAFVANELIEQSAHIDSLLKKCNEAIEAMGLNEKSGEISIKVTPQEGHALVFAQHLIVKMGSNMAEQAGIATDVKPEAVPEIVKLPEIEPVDPLTEELNKQFASSDLSRPDWNVN
jgi:hypothetical protein